MRRSNTPARTEAASSSSSIDRLLRRVPDDLIVTLTEARQLLGLPKNCLPREARLGRLKVSRRAGKLWTTGAWLRTWIESGLVRRRQVPTEPSEVRQQTPPTSEGNGGVTFFL